MYLSSVLRNALFLLTPLSLSLTTYLYLYPLFHLCAFPSPAHDAPSSLLEALRTQTFAVNSDPTAIAPFRLLALGDPQLEGNTALPSDEASSFPNIFKIGEQFSWRTERSLFRRVQQFLHASIDVFFDDVPIFFEYYRKCVDIVGNDYYLAHIYRTLHWWTKPTHVAVLGDLIGSQWIDDEEFEKRAWRYWNIVFRHGEKVSDELTDPSADNDGASILLGSDDGWENRIINIAGNHDIGYAGDLTEERIDRFERVYGKASYDLRFRLATNADSELPTPELRIVNLNDMNLDLPATSKPLQDRTYAFLNSVILASREVTRPAHFTLVLTHIPLHKNEGICVDGPLFEYHSQGGDFAGGIREQNHLSEAASRGILEGIYGMSSSSNVDGGGMGRRGLIVNGHDHEGCDTYHFINQTASTEMENLSASEGQELSNEDGKPGWQAKRWADARHDDFVGRDGLPGVREITLRSMMGDFSGNAGLLSLWFDKSSWSWKFEYAACELGTTPVWWAIHSLDFATVVFMLAYAITLAINQSGQTLGSSIDHAKNKKTETLVSVRKSDHQEIEKISGTNKPHERSSTSSNIG